MLDIHNFVSTGSATNVLSGAGTGGISTGQYCTKGITRGQVLEEAETDVLATRQKSFSRFDVYGANETFVNGTFDGFTPVNAVDGRFIGKVSDTGASLGGCRTSTNRRSTARWHV